MPLETFTLDPDLLITSSTNAAEADMLCRLADRHSRGELDVAIVALPPVDAVGAIRAPVDEALRALGLQDLTLCLPMFDEEAGIVERCAPRSDEAIDLQFRIHQILFPNRAFEYDEARRKHGALEKDNRKFRQKWIESRRNVQTAWAHLVSGRDILVTNNQNFFKWTKMPSLLAIGVKSIKRLDSVAERP